jgi:hypothetical protein
MEYGVRLEQDTGIVRVEDLKLAHGDTGKAAGGPITGEAMGPFGGYPTRPPFWCGRLGVCLAGIRRSTVDCRGSLSWVLCSWCWRTARGPGTPGHDGYGSSAVGLCSSSLLPCSTLQNQ